MNTGKWTLVLSLALLFVATNSGFAQSGARPSLKTVTPDASQGEKSHIQVWNGDKLVESTISYTDGRSKIVAYRPDGTLSSVLTMPTINSRSITKFLADGLSKESTNIIGPGEFTQETSYHKDGKTPYRVITSTSRGDGEDVTEYFGVDGKPLAKQTYHGSLTEITVYDNTGKGSYTQMWASGIAGPVLLSLEETTPTGVRRRVHWRGGVKKVEYLKADGSVEKTESVDKGSLELAEPFDPKRLDKPRLN